MVTFGDILNKWMHERRISVEDLALGTGLTGTTLRKYLNNKGDLKVANLIKIAEFLKIPPEHLYPELRKIKGNNTGEAVDIEQTPESIYRDLVEANSEYRLIPKSILEEKYRLVEIGMIDTQNRTINQLLTAQEKLLNRIAELEVQALKVKGAN